MPAGVLALLLMLVVLAASPVIDPASAAEPKAERRLCSDRANVYDSPGGFVIGRLYKPAKVRVLRRSANKRWIHVRTRSRLKGWIIAGAVCKRRG